MPHIGGGQVSRWKWEISQHVLTALFWRDPEWRFIWRNVWRNGSLHIKQPGKEKIRYRGQIQYMFRCWWWGVKHSYKVGVGTGKAVFHDRVHMLTALRLWSYTLTAALDKPKSHRLSPLAILTEWKIWPGRKVLHEHFRRRTNTVDESNKT